MKKNNISNSKLSGVFDYMTQNNQAKEDYIYMKVRAVLGQDMFAKFCRDKANDLKLSKADVQGLFVSIKNIWQTYIENKFVIVNDIESNIFNLIKKLHDSFDLLILSFESGYLAKFSKGKSFVGILAHISYKETLLDKFQYNNKLDIILSDYGTEQRILDEEIKAGTYFSSKQRSPKIITIDEPSKYITYMAVRYPSVELSNLNKNLVKYINENYLYIQVSYKEFGPYWQEVLVSILYALK